MELCVLIKQFNLTLSNMMVLSRIQVSNYFDQRQYLIKTDCKISNYYWKNNYHDSLRNSNV